MITLQVKSLAASRIKKGYPALEDYDFKDKNKGGAREGDLVKLVDTSNKFIGIGYLGIENKRAGWVLSLDREEKIDERFYDRLFRIARDKRSSFFADKTTTAFRFFNSEGDGLGGLTIDYYDGFYVFSWYNKGLYSHREQILRAFRVAVPDYKGIYEKSNYPGAKVKSQFVEGEKVDGPLVILENGIRYNVYLNEGWMTGLFLDQRHVRRQIMESWGLGRKVLNAFSYTGAFSVAAAMGGATKTVNVDVANRSKERTTEQFEINGLDPSKHEIRVMDIFDYLDYAQKHQLRFDMIILDPPTFARTKKRTFSVEENYTELLREAIEVLAPNGILIASTNSWNVSRDDFYDKVSQAFDEEQVDAYLMDEYSLPEDYIVNPNYPDSNYLKVFVLEKTS
ncbi:class I SAM-dependent rRNA methyltransferase [Alkalibacterium iburiense]|uniref:Class I SAM-dependent rRNA methyltransferase n=1 Tax=Alkalibacterium iburiense TaxID=290589 RepID=A0ABP3H817_9LACT